LRHGADREEGVEEGMVEKELRRGWWRRTRAGCPTGCVRKREKEAVSGEGRPGGEGCMSMGFLTILMGPTHYVKFGKLAQNVSLTCYLFRISKNQTARTTSTYMLGCTNAFPNLDVYFIIPENP
jgi:hypothetical protein